MKNFARAVRLTLPHRMTLIAVFLTALLGGVLWGANIGAVGPFVEVIIHGRSIPAWIDEEIKETRTTIAELQASIDQLEQQLVRLADGEKKQTERELASSKRRLVAEQSTDSYREQVFVQ